MRNNSNIINFMNQKIEEQGFAFLEDVLVRVIEINGEDVKICFPNVDVPYTDIVKLSRLTEYKKFEPIKKVDRFFTFNGHIIDLKEIAAIQLYGLSECEITFAKGGVLYPTISGGNVETMNKQKNITIELQKSWKLYKTQNE